MFRFLLWRLSQVVILSLVIVSVVFLAARLVPGDPAEVLLGPRATEEEVARLREEMGLNKPILEQYAEFIGDMVRGTLGKSYIFEQPVEQLVLERLPFTLLLAVVTMGWILLVGIPLGVLAALRSNSWVDYVLRIVVFIGQSIAEFWLAIMLILAFSVTFRMLPTFGTGSWQHFILPSVALGLPRLARVMRFTRMGMLEALKQDYVRTARSKGLAERRVIFNHAFRNMLIPLVTDSGLTFAWLLGGAVVIETVFALPGIGRLTVEAVRTRDYIMIQGAVLVFALTFLSINLVMDIAYRFLDPRIRVA